MLEIYEEVGKKAGTYFDSGYNCAQAVALSNIETLGGQTSGIIELAAGFGEGLGAGCTCGALAGGVMALGVLLANLETKGFDRRIVLASAELHRRFVAEFGTACCRSLRKKLSPFKNKRCRGVTVVTSPLAMEIVLANKQGLAASVGI